MNTETPNPVDLEAFDQEIRRLAEIRFAKNEPALINALGLDLGATLAQVKAATGRTFAQYLRDRFSDEFDIVEVKANTPGLWPKGKAFQPKAFAYSERVGRPTAARRYLRWFWNAFDEPLAGQHRFFDPKERRIIDAENGEPSWIEIPEGSVRKADDPRNVRQIHHRIEEWLRDSGQPPEGFLDVDFERPVATSARSVLDAVLESLSPRQLQSVTMSLDIVAELARRPV